MQIDELTLAEKIVEMFWDEEVHPEIRKERAEKIQKYLDTSYEEGQKDMVETILSLDDMHTEPVMGAKKVMVTQEGVRNAFRARLKQKLEEKETQI